MHYSNLSRHSSIMEHDLMIVSLRNPAVLNSGYVEGHRESPSLDYAGTTGISFHPGKSPLMLLLTSPQKSSSIDSMFLSAV